MESMEDADGSSEEFEDCGGPFMVSLEHLTDDCKINEEEIAEMTAEQDDEDASSIDTIAEEGSKKTYLLDSKDGTEVNIRQMASVLLSDTSESDIDVESNQMDGVDVQTIQEEMYNAFKIQIKKQTQGGDAFMKSWIENQRTVFMRWKKKQESRKDVGKHKFDENKEIMIPEASSILSEEIPRFTELTVKPHYSKKQIEEEMGKMDKEKRERWEKLFIQFELRKSMRPPVLKSDLRRDFNKLQRSNGQEDLVEYYKTALSNLKEDVRLSVMKLEHVISELEAKEQAKSQGIYQSLGGDTVKDGKIDTDEESELTEVSSASEEFLTEDEMDRYEERLNRNVVVAPNIQKIKQLLETKIVFPEAEQETVELGCTLRDVERSLLESKGLECYISRIVYFYIYRSNYSAESVKTAYESIVKDVRIAKESESTSNKGCLLIYENVNMAIVMVEGEEFEILKHLTKFKSSLLPGVKRGKVLYVHRNLLKLYFNKWVTRTETPPAGKITYLTKSKKVLYRTAASRVVRTSEMLDRLYRHLSKEERYLVDPRSIYIKSKYIVMLPSPALFGYLLKYNILRDIRNFIGDLGKPLDISSDEEELFALTEDTMYSNYIDSEDDEEIMTQKLNYVKDVIKPTHVGGIAEIKKLSDIKIKDTEEVVSWDEYSIDDITSTIVDSRIKLSEDTEHPAVRLASAIEAHQSVLKGQTQDKYLGSKQSSHEFLSFLERGSEKWNNKMKWYGKRVTQVEASKGPNVEKDEGGEKGDEPDEPSSVEQSIDEESLEGEESSIEDSSTESSNSHQIDSEV